MQLYSVVTHARLKDGDIVNSKYILAAENPAAVEARMRWLIDLSEYSSWVIASVDKLKHGMFVVHHMARPSAGHLEPILVHNEHGPAIKAMDLPTAELHRYSVNVACAIVARSAQHAWRKLAVYLESLGLEAPRPCPMQDGHQLMISMDDEGGAR